MSSMISCLVTTAMVPKMAPEGQGSGIPHKDLCRMGVKPEKA